MPRKEVINMDNNENRVFTKIEFFNMDTNDLRRYFSKNEYETSVLSISNPRRNTLDDILKVKYSSLIFGNIIKEPKKPFVFIPKLSNFLAELAVKIFTTNKIIITNSLEQNELGCFSNISDYFDGDIRFLDNISDMDESVKSIIREAVDKNTLLTPDDEFIILKEIGRILFPNFNLYGSATLENWRFRHWGVNEASVHCIIIINDITLFPNRIEVYFETQDCIPGKILSKWSELGFHFVSTSTNIDQTIKCISDSSGLIGFKTFSTYADDCIGCSGIELSQITSNEMDKQGKEICSKYLELLDLIPIDLRDEYEDLPGFPHF